MNCYIVTCLLFLSIVNTIGNVHGGLFKSRVRTQPEQIHLSLGSNPSEMTVTWTTFDRTDQSIVGYGKRKIEVSVSGYSSKFTDGGFERRSMYIHRATMTNLEPGETYVYRVGSDLGWSPIFWFKAIKNGSDWSPRLAVYGDLGNDNSKSLPRLQEDAQSGRFDAIHHNGDFAYDLHSDNARIGDEFMRQIEPIAAYVPYQTSVGNHEQAYNFSNYVNRFSMVDTQSGQINNHFYSYNLGPAHIISFSTEFYFFIQYGLGQMFTQFEWLEADLIEANKPENREQRPWIITLGHRPMYCNTDGLLSILDDCRQRESVVRKGLPIFHLLGLEDLFYKYGVDLEIWAHEHLYERLWPIYDQKVYNGSTSEPYTNPGAPVHVTTGSAGCPEGIDPFVSHPADWSAVRISDYGFSVMTIHNKTHLTYQQLSADKNHSIVDQFTIVKDKHGPYRHVIN